MKLTIYYTFTLYDIGSNANYGALPIVVMTVIAK